MMLNKDNQITIGHKKRERFKSLLHNYLADRATGNRWSLDQLQYLTGLISYYRMVNREDTDKLLRIYSEEFHTDLERAIKEDLVA